MKTFFRSLLTSLMIGIPVVMILCVILYLNHDSFRTQESKENPVSADRFGIESEEIISDESLSFDVTSDETIDSPSESKGAAALSFAGDVHFSELVLQNYDKNGVSAIVSEGMLSHMEQADLLMLNHEFVFSNGGEAMADKQYTLKNDPKYVKILQELHTDVVGIANNHILDFGQDAFLDTLDTLDNADISYVGGGRNFSEASAPFVQTINGHTFAIFAATRVSPAADWYAGNNRPGILQTYDASSLNQAIAEAEKQYDHIIVFVHWGIERAEIPEEYQRTLAKGYIDAGADLIIGAHPHVLQGFEYYKGVPICYSLGNFLFGNRTGETLLLNALFDENGALSVQLIPCERICGVLTEIQEPKQLFHHLTDLSFGAAVSQSGILVDLEN